MNVTFKWDAKKSLAAVELAKGKSQQEVAKQIQVNRRTIIRWLEEEEFSAEVDRLSAMVDTASRAHRMRLVMRAVRQRLREDGTVETKRDILDWLKFAQSETNGIKLDLTALPEVDSA
jgi:transposase